jgi:hypothetical protein
MFNLKKLVKLGELHYQDFTVVEIYIVHVRRHVAFSICEDIFISFYYDGLDWKACCVLFCLQAN